MKCINTMLATSAFFTAVSYGQDADTSNTANTVSSTSALESAETALPTIINDAGSPGYTTASTDNASTSESDGLSTQEAVPINTDGSQASTGHTAHPTTATTHTETAGTTHEPLPTTLGGPRSTGHTAHPTTAHTHAEKGATTHGTPPPFGPRPSGDGMKVMIDGTLYVPATMCGGDTDYPGSEEFGSGGWAPPRYGDQSSDAIIHPTGGVVSSCSGDKHGPTAGGYVGATTLHTITSSSSSSIIETGGHGRPTSTNGPPTGALDDGETATNAEPACRTGATVEVKFPSSEGEDREFSIPLTNTSHPIAASDDGVWAKKMDVLPCEGEDGKARSGRRMECAAFSDKEGEMAVGEAVRAGEKGRLMEDDGGEQGGENKEAEMRDEEKGVKVRAVRCWRAGSEE